MSPNGLTLYHATVQPQAGPFRGPPVQQGAAGGSEIMVGVFRVDTRLHSVAPGLDVLLLKGKGFPGGDSYLPFHQVQAEDCLRYWMFHLKAGIHFQEIELRRAGGPPGTPPCRR